MSYQDLIEKHNIVGEMDTNLPTLKYRTYVRSQNTEWITLFTGQGVAARFGTNR